MESPAGRAFVTVGGALAAVAVVTLAFLAVAGVLDPFQAGVLAGLVAVLVLVIVLAVMVWKTQQAVRAAQRELMSALPQYRTPVEPIVAAVQAESSDLSSAISREQQQLYWQLEALLDLRAQLSFRAPLPPLRGWAASPDVLHWMLTWARYHEPRLIVECGSGISTVLFGYHVQRAGDGRVIALEHDRRFAAHTVELAQRHGVDDVIDVREAPLREWEQDDRKWRWYDLALVEDLAEIDLLFIDGPPEATGELARFPAGPVLLHRLSSNGVAVLDDSSRADESRASDLWLEQLPGLEREQLKTDKGTDVFRRRPQ